MVVLTPGIAFLAPKGAFLVIAGFLLVGLGRYHIFPLRILILLTFVSGPLTIAVRNLYIDLRDQQDAAAMGARIVPKVKGQWIGNFDVFRMITHNLDFGYPGDGFGELLETTGPAINMDILWTNILFTTAPEHIKTMLYTDFPNYIKGEQFRRAFVPVFGTVTFTSDGDMWKSQRSKIRSGFTRKRINDFEILDRNAAQAILQMRNRMRASFAVDFQDLMYRFALDSVSEFFLGPYVHTLSDTLPYPHNMTTIPVQPTSLQAQRADAFSTALFAVLQVMARREQRNWLWPLYEILEDKTVAPMKIIHGYIEPIVEEAIRKNKSMPEEEKNVDSEYAESETLLDHLVNISPDPTFLRDFTFSIMMGGRDTSASVLTFTMYLLSLHPEVTARLRTEILEKVGPNRTPDVNDIRDMKYLRAVINETMRLFPSAPFSVRENTNATTLPSTDPNEKPFYIPGGTKIGYSVLMMHRRKNIWGPDAEEFDPDRFLDDRLERYLMKNPFIFLPFSAGPRICPGQQFAYNQISFMLIRLLQNFTSIALQMDAADPGLLPPAEWAGTSGRKGREKVFPKFHLTLYARGGLWVKMQETQED